MVENTVKEQDVTYMEAVLNFMKTNDIGFESINKLLSPEIKEQIRLEASEQRMLPTK